MSGKLFNFLCSQLERKNSRRTIDLSVNLIFRRIHVYQNGHVPIYRFPSVFFIFFSQKEFFMLTNGTTYQTANRLERFVGFEALLGFVSVFQDLFFYCVINYFIHVANILWHFKFELRRIHLQICLCHTNRTQISDFALCTLREIP